MLVPERIRRLVVVGEGCWTSTSWHNSAGYAYTHWEGRDHPLHRVLFEILIGPVPGLDLDHLCRNTRCVNPGHLEPVTHRENIRRGKAATKTSCKYGHDWNEPRNVLIRTNGTRICAECNRQRCRQHYAQRVGRAS